MKAKNNQTAVLPRLYRLVRHWRWIAWPAIILGLISIFIFSIRWWMKSIGDEVTGWWTAIEDPTERGCAYIATAIAAHAVVMAFKTMSHDRIKVELKEKDSQPNATVEAPKI